MDEILTSSSGTFSMERYRGLKILETVEFSSETASEFADVGHVLEDIAQMGKESPCKDCAAILDVIRELAWRHEKKPEEMISIEIECAPSAEDPGFYTVVGTLPKGETRSVRVKPCQLLLWMAQNRPKNTNGG